MTFLAPIPIATVLTVAGVLAALAVVAYILKMRRRRFEVPFSALWQRVLQERESSSLFKHLRRLLSLLLQLLILALLIVAVLDPQLGSPDRDAHNVVIILDASASMKALDGRVYDAAGEAEPSIDGTAGDRGDTRVVIGSEDARTRMDVAREQARQFLSTMGGGDRAMIIRMDGQSTPLGRFDDDKAALARLVDRVRASDTPADLERALNLAADALRDRQNPVIVLIGDGAYPSAVTQRVRWHTSTATPAAANAAATAGEASESDDLGSIDLANIDVRYIPIGQTGENVGIVAFNARRYITDKTSYAAFIEVENFGQEPAARKLVVYSGDSAVDVKTIALAPGQRMRQLYPGLGGGQDNRMRAELQPVDAQDANAANTNAAGVDNADPDRVPAADVFTLDDRAYALLPARKKQKVLLVTADNLYLEGAMLVYDSIQVDKLTAEEYDRAAVAGELGGYDAVVFDGHTPESLPPPGIHLMYFDPQGPHSPIAIRRRVSAPRVTETAEAHPVMRWVVMSDVNFDASSVFAVSRARGEVALAQYVRDPIIAAKRTQERKIAVFGFNLAGTDLTLRVAFPLLLLNTLDWFAGDDADLLTTYTTGKRLSVPLDGVANVSQVDVITPAQQRLLAPVSEGRASFYAHSIGRYRLVARSGTEAVAEIDVVANLANPAESAIAPAAELALGGQVLPAPEEFSLTRRQSLWVYLVLAALLLLCLEWFSYHRRITV